MSDPTPTPRLTLDNPVERLSRLREWIPEGHGVQLGSRMLAIMDWIDAQLVTVATKAGAREMLLPKFISRSILERAGYFDSFSPEGVVHEADGECLSPAACYHFYAQLAAASLSGPGVWTCIARCGRKEEKQELGRLRTFMMREIVLVGTAAWLREQRQEWMDRILAFARSLQMMVTLRPATDPFFAGGAARGMMLLQQLKQLKYELRAPVDAQGTELALASFNLHETFFSRRFGFGLNGAIDTHSGCIAFGLERWALALALQLGPEQAFKLLDQERK